MYFFLSVLSYPWLTKDDDEISHDVPESSDFSSLPVIQQTTLLRRAPKISDPIDEDRYSKKFQAMTDSLYQDNFSVNVLNEKALKNERPKSNLINIFNCEMRHIEKMETTHSTKGKTLFSYKCNNQLPLGYLI